MFCTGKTYLAIVFSMNFCSPPVGQWGAPEDGSITLHFTSLGGPLVSTVAVQQCWQFLECGPGCPPQCRQYFRFQLYLFQLNPASQTLSIICCLDTRVQSWRNVYINLF